MRFLRGNFSLLAVGVFSLAFVAGCSQNKTDSEKIHEAIGKLESGETAEAISKDLVQPIHNGNHSKQVDRPQHAQTVLDDSATTVTTPDGVVIEDPCAVIPNVAPDVTDEAREAAVNLLTSCFRSKLTPSTLYAMAIAYYKVFNLQEGVTPFSQMSEADLEQFIKDNSLEFELELELSPERQTLVRNSYSDADLVELVALSKKRLEALKLAEEQVFQVISQHELFVQALSKQVDRYGLLWALYKTKGDVSGARTVVAAKQLMNGSFIDFPDEGLPGFDEYLHPFGILVAIPELGSEFSMLDPRFEHPYAAIYGEKRNFLLGDDESVNGLLDIYRAARDFDNKPVPTHPASAADAVGVAVMDSGIDYEKYAELGLFLNVQDKDNLDPTQLASKDYSDNDMNPYVPSLGGLAHGSGTSATVLTLIAKQKPELLQDRKVELAMWKVWSTRDLLAGPMDFSGLSWESRVMPIVNAVIDQVESPAKKPKIVSVSLGFKFERFIQKANKPELLKQSPWLWVMAAGNSGVKVEDQQFSCFEDVPAERRPDERILCVGALKRESVDQNGDIVGKQIAAYSNYGDRVQVYAYESYIRICPNGTSCSTPAIASAATMIAGAYPQLTPEQIKEVIVEAAKEEELPVEVEMNFSSLLMGLPVMMTQQQSALPPGLLPFPMEQEKRVVKVFDPETMMESALQIAKTKAEAVVVTQ